MCNAYRITGKCTSRETIQTESSSKRSKAMCQKGGRGFKSAFKKAFNFAKKISKNKAVKNIGRAIISEAPGALEGLSKKVKNKKLKAILNSDIAKTGVDLATGFPLDKLQ